MNAACTSSTVAHLHMEVILGVWHQAIGKELCCIAGQLKDNGNTRLHQLLKTVDTIGNCQRLVFTACYKDTIYK